MSENNINKETNNNELSSKKTGGDIQHNTSNSISENSKSSQNNVNQGPASYSRRDALKTLATVPVLGAMAYGVYKKRKNELVNRSAADMFRFPSEIPQYVPSLTDGKTIRLGIIGSGIRGKQLMEGLGFATPEYVQDLIQQNINDSKNTRYKDFLEQEDLNIRISAICDIFDVHAEEAMRAGANIHREGIKGKFDKKPVRYRNYKELLAADDVDAVVIASPDHWHGQMAMDAIRAGKHVYLEKPMTWTVPETYALRSLVRSSNLVFQLGHQNRQIEAYERAREIIEKGLLGPITLVETGTNRNDPNGAWVYDINPEANPKTID